MGRVRGERERARVRSAQSKTSSGQCVACLRRMCLHRMFVLPNERVLGETTHARRRERVYIGGEARCVGREGGERGLKRGGRACDRERVGASCPPARLRFPPAPADFPPAQRATTFAVVPRACASGTARGRACW